MMLIEKFFQKKKNVIFTAMQFCFPKKMCAIQIVRTTHSMNVKCQTNKINDVFFQLNFKKIDFFQKKNFTIQFSKKKKKFIVDEYSNHDN